MLIKKHYSQYAPLIKHLRDVNCENLHCTRADLYQLLFSLPRSISLAQVLEELKGAPEDEQQALERMLANQSEPENGYPVRDLCLYGLAEIERSRQALSALDAGDPERFGELMYVSHDGDRVVNEEGKPYNWSLSDAAFQRLIKESDQQPLHLQPGGYACSTRTIDRIVDTARKLTGVYGAQIAGAGLGGCAMILSTKHAAANVVEKLNGLGFEATVMRPVQGACAL